MVVTTAVRLLSPSVTCSNGFVMTCVSDTCTKTTDVDEQESSNNMDNIKIKINVFTLSIKTYQFKNVGKNLDWNRISA